MRGSACRPWLLLDHLDEMADLPELTGELRALRVLCRAADLAQPEGPQRAAVPLALADRATNLPDLDLRHSLTPEAPRMHRRTPQQGRLRAPSPAPPHPTQHWFAKSLGTLPRAWRPEGELD